MIDLSKIENRRTMRKAGFTEKQLEALYVKFGGYRVIHRVLFTKTQ